MRSRNDRQGSITGLPDGVAEQIAAHELWLASEGGDGEQVNFVGQDLTNKDISKRDLRRSNFERADFSGAFVAGTDFRGAILRLANFKNANVKDVNFTEADLRDANFSDVRGLTAEQLMRANLAGATLPDAVKSFDGLAHVHDSAGIARPLFLLNLAFCIYAIAVISSTTDAAMLTNARSSILPDISTPIPTKGFYYIFPAMLFSVYIYFHVHIEQIIFDIMRLPSVFPDGIPITRKIYPWILLILLARDVSNREKIISDGFSRTRTITNLVVVALAWWLTPLTLALVWLKFLPTHDWYGAIWIILLTIGAVSGGGIGIQSLRLGRTHPGFAEADLNPWRSRIRRGNEVRYALTATIGVFMVAVTYGAFYGARGEGVSALNPKSWSPAMLNAIGLSAFANFKDIEVSTRDSDTNEVRGAELAGRDMAFIIADNAFMEKANLRNANLSGATLQGANLGSADASSANLRSATARDSDFSNANLRGAVLDKSLLNNANFDFATLSEASFVDVNMSAASLHCARANETDFKLSDLRTIRGVKARFDRAEMNGADLTGAKLPFGNFQFAVMSQTTLHSTNFDHADFSNADLSNAIMTSASFREADFTGAIFFESKSAKATQPPSYLPDFSGADLEFAIGVTQSFLDGACGDENTRLPENLFIQTCSGRTIELIESPCPDE